MYTIKRAAELVGVSASTLRAWERRYGIAAPRRTPSGYRLYDDAAVRRLSRMRVLVRGGWSTAGAAEEVLRHDVDGSGGASTDSLGAFATEELAHAAAAHDGSMVGRSLDHHFGVASFEVVVDGWLMPALSALGEAWAAGRVDVAGEHLVANAVARRLSTIHDATASALPGPRVVVGLPPGSRHELGLLSFTVAVRRAGLATDYLGADLPVSDWVAAVGDRRADAAVLTAAADRDVEALIEVAHALRTAHPGLVVAVGGAEQEQAPDHCLRLGHEIGRAATDLASHLLVPTGG